MTKSLKRTFSVLLAVPLPATPAFTAACGEYGPYAEALDAITDNGARLLFRFRSLDGPRLAP